MSDGSRNVLAPIVLAGLGVLFGALQMMPSTSVGAKQDAAVVGAAPAVAVAPSIATALSVPAAVETGALKRGDGATMGGVTGRDATAAPIEAGDATSKAVSAKDGKGVVMAATEDDIAAAEADLQAAKDELQSKLTRSLPGGVSIAKPEVGMELKRLREDVEAKQRRVDEMRKE